MIREVIVSAKTVEDAVKEGAKQLGVSEDIVKVEVLAEAKKGFLGIGAADAQVKVYFELTPAMKAKEFLETIVSDMGINGEIHLVDSDETSANITLNGESEELGILIGHHGDVLDSIQYLASLAANIEKDEFYRVNVDINDYRKKREETLRSLARKKAANVAKTRHSFVFEPMSANERRIIHSELQDFEGINTHSVGQDEERKVIISAAGAGRNTHRNNSKRR